MTKKTRRRYTAEFKAAAVARLGVELDIAGIPDEGLKSQVATYITPIRGFQAVVWRR